MAGAPAVMEQQEREDDPLLQDHLLRHLAEEGEDEQDVKPPLGILRVKEEPKGAEEEEGSHLKVKEEPLVEVVQDAEATPDDLSNCSENRRFYFGAAAKRKLEEAEAAEEEFAASPNQLFWRPRTKKRASPKHEVEEDPKIDSVKQDVEVDLKVNLVKKETEDGEDVKRCFLCLSLDHGTADCPQVREAKCRRCREKGHQALQCPNRKKRKAANKK